MSKLKLKLNPDPTFVAAVEIATHGGNNVPVNFTFKHRTREAMKVFFDGLKDREDADNVLEMAVGWELDDEFNRENIVRLLENYIGSSMAIFNTYTSEISQARIKN